MGTLTTILIEEFERLEKLQSRYEKELQKLPKGVLSLKKRKEESYAYLAYRKNNKIITDYIGHADSDIVIEMRKKIQKRKELKSLLKTTKERIMELKRVLRGKKI